MDSKDYTRQGGGRDGSLEMGGSLSEGFGSKSMVGILGKSWLCQGGYGARSKRASDLG